MTFKNAISALLILSIVPFFSCTEEENEFRKDVQSGSTFSGTIKITARHYFPSGNRLQDTLLTGAEVLLFSDPQDRSLENNPVLSTVTDTNGEASFVSLPDSIYYVLGKYPIAKNAEETVNFNNSGEITFVELRLISN